ALDKAQLQGASLPKAQLQGAWLPDAQLQGAKLDGAQLQGTTLTGAQLQGASLDGAQLQGAKLDAAQLQGASLPAAELQGANLNGAQLQGARLVNVRVWRAFGTLNLDLADLHNIDPPQKPWEEPLKDNETFGEWRDAIANSADFPLPVPHGRAPEGDLRLRNQMIARLAVLDPTEKKEPKDVLDQRYWDRAPPSQP